MKKFIAAFDGLRFSKSNLQYAINITQQENAHLVGVFLEDFMRRSYGTLEMARYAGEQLEDYREALDARDDDEKEKSRTLFERACTKAGISFSLHRNSNVALQELLLESVYADLLLVSAGESMQRSPDSPPSQFVRTLLNEVQCPVLLTPPLPTEIEKVVLLYDGEPSSVYAAKMFSYVLTGMKSLDTAILTVQEEAVAGLPNSHLIEEFIQQHYPKAKKVVLQGNAEDEIATYLQSSEKYTMAVCGAYQRSGFSRLFKRSMADVLLETIALPLFVAHNKS